MNERIKRSSEQQRCGSSLVKVYRSETKTANFSYLNINILVLSRAPQLHTYKHKTELATDEYPNPVTIKSVLYSEFRATSVKKLCKCKRPLTESE